MVFFAKWNKVVFVVLVEVVYLPVPVCLFLFRDMMDIFDVRIAEGAFAEIERFVVFAAFLFLQFFDVAA